jgi:hypothetical protein
LLKIMLMLSATLGRSAPAARATKPAINAYSIRSWTWISAQIHSAQSRSIADAEASYAPGKVSPPGNNEGYQCKNVEY